MWYNDSMMKFDMHCHTKGGSIDSSVSVERYIELLKARGFDGMVITDHDSYKGYHKWLKNQGGSFWKIGADFLRKKSADEEEQKDFCVLAGIEYDTKDAGHFLVIMPDHVKLKILQVRGMPVETLIHIVHRFGGILGSAHPFGTRSSSAMFFKKIKKKPSILQEVDFIEGFNTCEKEYANEMAADLARKLGKPCVGGSDAHNEKYVGMAYTLFDRKISCNDDLIAAVKNGQVAGCGGQVREHTTKAKMKDAFYSVWGFKAYNRSLGALFSPYRKYKIHKLAYHHPEK